MNGWHAVVVGNTVAILGLAAFLDNALKRIFRLEDDRK